MPQNPKPASVLAENSGKRIGGHRTKAEIAMRKKAEEGLLTGEKIKEDTAVRKNPTAHKAFLKTRKLLSAIGKDDALYSAQVNRYAMITAECEELIEKREAFWQQLQEFENEKRDAIKNEEMTYAEAVKIEQKYQSNILAMDRQVQLKRKALFDLERENCMSVASSLRSIPKTPDKSSNPLLDALKG